MSEKCPKCGGEVAYYQVTRLNVKDGPHDRHIGCGADDGACLLAKKSWTLNQWEEIKAVFGHPEPIISEPMPDVSIRQKRAEVFAIAVALKSSGRLDRLIGENALKIWHHVNDALENDR